MSTTLTPVDLATATKIGRRTYRKQILPFRTIDYNGRKITFDRAYVTDLAESFQAEAYDQVPIIYADGDNRHTMDPRLFTGEVKGFEVTSTGLDAIVELSEEGAALIDKNPRLGVSARIMEGLAKSNGKTFKRAIQHVLLTMDPRVPGLAPWRQVDLAVYNAAEDMIDLSNQTFKETDVADTATKDKGKAEATDDDLDLESMSDEDFLALLNDDPDAEEDPEDQSAGDDAADDEAGDEEESEEESDEDAEDEDDPEADDEGDSGVEDMDVEDVEDDEEEVEEVVGTPAGKRKRLKGKVKQTPSTDLSNEVRQGRVDLATERWERKREALVNAGVPPHMLDLAAPIMSSPDAAVIDLSETEQVDAKQVIANLLDGAKGTIDLTPQVGSSVDLSAGDEDPDAAVLAAWDRQYGTV